ncbi:MAG: DNA gyrase C-terminal beta-propeller domain-containing protein, partial [Salinisphaeraceae bacterium]|nr:DNA gyrase C-terminal beta-propeller domain-containing protein [Salinisphaeraceae bacterium]
RGYGKRTPIDDYPVHKRGGQGVSTLKGTAKTGRLVSAKEVLEDDEIMLITNSGSLVRTGVKDISSMSRNTQGVKIIRVTEDDRLVGVDRIVTEDDADEVVAEAEAGAEEQPAPVNQADTAVEDDAEPDTSDDAPDQDNS